MDALVESEFEEYTKRHYQSWVRFARDKGIGDDIRPVLVSGFDLTKGDTSFGADLTIAVPALPSDSTSPWGTWRAKRPPHTNQGPSRHNPLPPERAVEFPQQSAEAGNVPREFNQCVFLRYYAMRPRRLLEIFPEVIRAGAGPHELRPGDNKGEIFLEPAVQPEVRSPASDDEGLEGRWDLVDEDDGSELDITGYNTPYVCSFPCPFVGILTLPEDEERDIWDIVADYVFQVIHFLAASPDNSPFSTEEFQRRVGVNAPP